MAQKRYDVYLEDDTSPEDDNLVIVQFPGIRSQFENEPERLHLSIKPKSMKLKLDVDLNTHSHNYCKDKGELLARVSKPQIFPDKQVDKNFYISTKNNVNDAQLFICKTVNNRIVCRPIAHFVTMRSDLSHFDLKDEVDPREEVKPVSVKFAATERQNVPNKRAQDTQEELDEALEEYYLLKFKGMGSREAESHRVALFGKHTRIKPDPDAEHIDMKPDIQQIPDIKPKIEKMDVDDIYSNAAKSVQSSPKKSKMIRDLVKECLMKAKLVSFEEVYRYVKDYRNFSHGGVNDDRLQINSKDIIDALNEYAVLVQGNWAIKSEVFYGDSGERECTDVTDIPINLFTAARDYLIWLFNQNRIVSRPEYSAKVKIPDHDILELFNQLALFRTDIKKWELKLPTDQRFLDRFPEVVQRQTTFWKVRKANRLSAFQ